MRHSDASLPNVGKQYQDQELDIIDHFSGLGIVVKL
jgi:hypothetical protein